MVTSVGGPYFWIKNVYKKNGKLIHRIQPTDHNKRIKCNESDVSVEIFSS